MLREHQSLRKNRRFQNGGQHILQEREMLDQLSCSRQLSTYPSYRFEWMCRTCTSSISFGKVILKTFPKAQAFSSRKSKLRYFNIILRIPKKMALILLINNESGTRFFQDLRDNSECPLREFWNIRGIISAMARIEKWCKCPLSY